MSTAGTAGAAFDAVIADLDYPMFIVTAADGRERAGCLVGFATQCSLDPPRFAVWLSKRNRTYRVAQGARTLVVHLPSAEQTDLAELFGGQTGDEVDKFVRCRWRPGPDGAPVLLDCRRWLAGRILEVFDTGDHVGFLLDPVAGAAEPWPGQLGFQAVRTLNPGHDA